MTGVQPELADGNTPLSEDVGATHVLHLPTGHVERGIDSATGGLFRSLLAGQEGEFTPSLAGCVSREIIDSSMCLVPTSPNLSSSLVRLNADKSGGSEQTVSRPFHDRHLHNRQRLDPSERRHVGMVIPSPQCPLPVLFARLTNGHDWAGLSAMRVNTSFEKGRESLTLSANL